ncbi:hypothetical protein ABZX44_02940, partial [Streptomyces antibioticus]
MAVTVRATGSDTGADATLQIETASGGRVARNRTRRYELGRVSKVPPAPRRLARTLAALPKRPNSSAIRA